MWCNFALSEEAVDAARQRQKIGLQTVGKLVGEDVDVDEAAETIDELVDERVQAAIDSRGHE